MLTEISLTNKLLDKLGLKFDWDLRDAALVDTSNTNDENNARREAIAAIASGDTARMKRVLESM